MKNENTEVVIFDMFFRVNPDNAGYSVMAGLEQVVDYIKNLNFTYEDIDYFRKLGIFSNDFLDYLSGFHFSGCHLRDSGRNPDLPERATA